MLQMAMSSGDKFGENMDSIAVMKTRVKTHCTPLAGKRGGLVTALLHHE